jgi:DNA mismatch repair ATPase MutS
MQLKDYLAKLIKRGYKVAICEQLTKPGETRGIVERDVIRLVTPGTIVEPGLFWTVKPTTTWQVLLLTMTWPELPASILLPASLPQPSYR